MFLSVQIMFFYLAFPLTFKITNRTFLGILLSIIYYEATKIKTLESWFWLLTFKMYPIDRTACLTPTK